MVNGRVLLTDGYWRKSLAALRALAKVGFAPEQMITTLEKRMKCGIGKCGRCNIGNLYVCQDGPVFTYAQIKNFVSSEY